VEIVGRRSSSPRVPPSGSLDPILAWLALLEPIAREGAPALRTRVDLVVTS
jgi:hypothetical protein